MAQYVTGGGPSPRGGPERPRAAGKFLFVGDQKLRVRGVTYGAFRPGGLGIPFPDRAQVRVDFAAMAEAGFNAVRTYTVPPEWLLDERFSAPAPARRCSSVVEGRGSTLARCGQWSTRCCATCQMRRTSAPTA